MLVRRLREAGKRVRIFDIHERRRELPAASRWSGPTSATPPPWQRACEGVAWSHHNVALVPLAKDKQAFWGVNRDGTRNLLEACEAHGVRKVVHMSSSAVYGAPESNPVTDGTRPCAHGGLWPGQAGRRGAVPRIRRPGTGRHDHPPPHDHGPRPPRDHADPLRVDPAGEERSGPGQRRTTSISSSTPTIWRAWRSGRRSTRAGRPTTAAPSDFGTMRETLLD